MMRIFDMGGAGWSASSLVTGLPGCGRIVDDRSKYSTKGWTNGE